MKIQLISHSCAIVETVDCRILADPWILGGAFNDSWKLFPEPAFDESMLDDVDFIWISHEHPDHFNIPTLRSFPESFRQRVTVLYQQNNSQKMFDAFERLGYPNHRALPHREIVRITPETEVYCYQVGQMDSCLGVRDPSGIVLNVNDAFTNDYDTRAMKHDLGPPDAILNQFSIAGYGGFEDYEEHLSNMAHGHIDHMIQTHRGLGAKVTIPFASFVVFSCEDNRYVNDYANTPADVADGFSKSGETTAILYLGDVYDTEHADDWDSQRAITLHRRARERLASLEYDAPASKSVSEIRETFQARQRDLSDKYPRLLLARLKPVTVRVPDLETTIRFSVADGSFEEVTEDDARIDLVVRSQPLWFAFSAPFGVQTLGVSARFRLLNSGDAGNWARHRVLFGLYNADFYLHPRHFFTGPNLRHLWARRRGMLSQIATRLALIPQGR